MPSPTSTPSTTRPSRQSIDSRSSSTSQPLSSPRSPISSLTTDSAGSDTTYFTVEPEHSSFSPRKILPRISSFSKRHGTDRSRSKSPNINNRPSPDRRSFSEPMMAQSSSPSRSVPSSPTNQSGFANSRHDRKEASEWGFGDVYAVRAACE
ncbi:MAG: hypothetical protein M1827_002590 [Pycnora praestabilis]|nr:MAG: hypothetical protein M1827_002590 [Pycnora praestabilis]